MFLKKNVQRLNQDKNFAPPTDALTNNKQATFTFIDAASELLEFRVFAIKHGHTYLSRIIEPVVTETLNIAHQLEQPYDPNKTTTDSHFRESTLIGARDLSTQEIECLKWCSLGKSYQEIANELGRQETTIMLQMKAVRKKLNTKTDAHSVATVIRLKMI